MSKIIIIPDVHGRTFWKQAVKDKSPNDIVIFLGDYLEPYTEYEGITHEDAYKNFKEILKYKKEHLSDCILLLGNHDFACIDSTMISCRHDYKNADRNTKLFHKNLHLFNLVHSFTINNKTFILSHSGIHKSWVEEQILTQTDTIDKDDHSINDVVNYLNDSFKNDYTQLLSALSVYSRYRGFSFYNYGSCVWADCREWSTTEEEFKDTYQIFGHTQLAGQPIVTGLWANLDCHRAFCLNTDSGVITELTGEEIKEIIFEENE